MRKAKQSESSRMMRPALTPEARENQLVSLAVDLAEKQLREGTASSQVITHYLKLGSTKERIEKEILKPIDQMTFEGLIEIAITILSILSEENSGHNEQGNI